LIGTDAGHIHIVHCFMHDASAFFIHTAGSVRDTWHAHLLPVYIYIQQDRASTPLAISGILHRKKVKRGCRCSGVKLTFVIFLSFFWVVLEVRMGSLVRSWGRKIQLSKK
jgi:hypothetical protein